MSSNHKEVLFPMRVDKGSILRVLQKRQKKRCGQIHFGTRAHRQAPDIYTTYIYLYGPLLAINYHHKVTNKCLRMGASLLMNLVWIDHHHKQKRNKERWYQKFQGSLDFQMLNGIFTAVTYSTPKNHLSMWIFMYLSQLTVRLDLILVWWF